MKHHPQRPENTVAGAWSAFRTIAMPHDCPPDQVREMRRAFYSGVQSCFDIQMRDLDPGTEPTDADMNRMESMYAELSAFGRAIQRGKA